MALCSGRACNMATGLVAFLVAACQLQGAAAARPEYSFSYSYYFAFEDVAPTPAAAPSAPTATHSVTVSLAVGFACSAYGDPEKAWFEAALESIITGSTVTAGSCAAARRRSLLAGSTLDFTITIPTTTTVASVTSSLTVAAINTALANTESSYTGTLSVSDASVTAVTVATFAPTAAPVTTVLSGSSRLVPGLGLAAACMAVFATMWV